VANQHGETGIPVDAFGGRTIDPTKNVLDLVRAANERQDDLRLAAVAHLEAEIAALKESVKETLAERDRRYMGQHESTNQSLVVGLAAQKDASDAALAAQREAVTAALTAQERAVSKAEAAAEKRFEGVNEFRNTLSDQQRNLMPRSEVGVLTGAMSDKIGALEISMNSKLGALEKQFDAIQNERAGIRGGWGYAVGAVGFLLAIGSLIMIGIRFVQQAP
jgi:hypothetical protein